MFEKAATAKGITGEVLLQLLEGRLDNVVFLSLIHILVAGGAMRAVLESVGITDVLAKSKGSSNPHNLVKATIEALSEMRDARMIAQNRGISVEKVFRG